MFLIFDTETTGLPKNWNAPITDADNWPRMVQLAWQLHAADGSLMVAQSFIVKPDGYTIPYNAAQVHGITTERAQKDGHDLKMVLETFSEDLKRAKYNVGHNIEFDINIVGAEYHRLDMEPVVTQKEDLDTKNLSVDFCAIPGGRGGRFKWPTLTELHRKLFGKAFADAHDAAYDVDATARCFFGLITHRVVVPAEIDNPDLVAYEAPQLAAANFEAAKEEKSAGHALQVNQSAAAELADTPFTHLHLHSQYSILQSTSQIKEIVETTQKFGMEAVALTDHGNMMATFHFVREAHNAGIKPIVGCEFNMCHDRLDKTRQNNGYQQVLIAKNKRGYHMLCKLASKAYTEGFYYVPRIDKKAILAFKEDLIAFTGGLWGEIPSKILNEGEKAAEEACLWWKEHFGDDFYLELQRHGLEEEKYINEVLVRFAEKHHIKYIATNNSYYTLKEDAEAHDVLLCVKDSEPFNKPKKYIGKRGREFRFGFPNHEYYIKSPDEMKALFADLPDAIRNTREVVDKVEGFELTRDPLLPKFDIPEEFIDPRDHEDGGKRGENAYLRHLTLEGAAKRYGTITDEIRERLDFELMIIEKTGYPGYFLIVQDFTNEARKMGVSVGPGRGSAAGSAVAYCTGITNVDPVAYDLLFERFLNPDRVSMPDIDIDFDDEGRGRVIDWVIEKYGANQVAQIITYGTMAAKSSIRDTARVLELPLYEADRIAKLVPDIKLKKLFDLSDVQLADKLNTEQLQMAGKLKKISRGADLPGRVVNQARQLEGSLRNTGIHACGVIIAPDDLTNFVPVSIAKDSSLQITQFDNAVVENAGLLKMDFLGLKTLTIIKDAIKIIHARHQEKIDPDEIKLDDPKTYALYQRGETNGTFQFESPGMQKHLKALKPDKFGDLIAMNALYRPGPLEYIPNFIARKHGREEIVYDLPDMEDHLAETYGITVYQEQVMLLSQKLANFTKGQADALRKAMGKKKREILDGMFPLFLKGGEDNGHPKNVLEKIWKDWEAFAAYAFNKSHSTCYSVVAFHTAYLKANYPPEYMASVLTHNMNDIKKVTFFMEECVRMEIPVLGPDVNESYYKFAVNTKGEIRFGLGAIKGVGEGPVEAIIEERKAHGPFRSVYDFVKRVDLRICNRKALESIVLGGGFDSFMQMHRAQYFARFENGQQTFLEKLVKFGQAYREILNAPPDLFGNKADVGIADPVPPVAEEWGTLEKLNREKEVVGIFISGHPLDDYKLEINNFCTIKVADLNDLRQIKGRELTVGGIVALAEHRHTKRGQPFGTLEMEDYSGSKKLFLFSEDYLRFRHFLVDGSFLYIEGTVQPKKWGNGDELEFKINSIDLLANVRQKAKGLNIQLELEDVTETLVNRVYELAEAHRGNCPLRFTIRDYREKMQLNMPSRTMKVDLNDPFIESLDAMEMEDVIKYEVTR